MNALLMSNGLRIIPVSADRMQNGSHGYSNAEFDCWVHFKFSEVSEPLAQVWTGIPFQHIERVTELNDGMPVRNYALHQLRDAILENEPDFDPENDYIYLYEAS